MKDVLGAKLEAIKNIVESLDKVPEEERSSVIRFVLEEMGIEKVAISNPAIPIANGDISQEDASNPVSSVPVDVKIDDFVGQKQPKDNYQITAVLAFYLKKYRGQKEFTTKELSGANLEARQQKISNMTDTLVKGQSRKHFFTSGVMNKKSKQITLLGEQVVEALPDQAKVKEIIARSPQKKSRKSPAKKRRASSSS